MTREFDKAAAANDFEFATLGEASHYRQRLIWIFASHLRGYVPEVGTGIGQTTAELRKHPAITS